MLAPLTEQTCPALIPAHRVDIGCTTTIPTASCGHQLHCANFNPSPLRDTTSQRYWLHPIDNGCPALTWPHVGYDHTTTIPAACCQYLTHSCDDCLLHWEPHP